MVALTGFIPFKNISVRGSFSVKDQSQILVTFAVEDFEAVIVNPLRNGSDGPWSRADGLWKTTCFEAFWGERGSSAYWELNVSANRDLWNLYRFDSYRSPQPPLVCEDFRLVRVERTSSQLVVELESPGALSEVEASLCAVIEVDGGVHYFSSKHASKKADFHLRESFLPVADFS